MRAVWFLTCLLLPVLTWSESFLDLVREADAATVQAAIDAGADLGARDGMNWTPLMYAASDNENAEVVQALLDAGADVTAREAMGGTPLMFAASYNESPKVLQLLIDAGADLEARNGRGNTPLMFAARDNENPEVLRLLLEAGADLEARNMLDSTPLMFAAEKNESAEVLQLLLDAGADLETHDGMGWTALMYVARYSDNPAMVHVLIDADADTTATNPDLESAWDLIQENEALSGTAAYAALKEEEDSYTINYFDDEADSGSPPVDDNVYAKHESVTLLDGGSLVRNGHDFDGWHLSSQEHSYYIGHFYPGDSFKMQPTNVFVYPAWEPVLPDRPANKREGDKRRK